MLGVRFLGRADRDQLDLLELMLADEAARVASGRSGLRPETGGQRGQPHRQGIGRHDLFGDQIGQRYLGGRDQPAAIGGAEQILGELRQLAGAEQRLVAHQQRRIGFLIAVGAALGVEHILRQRAVQPRHLATQRGEARARQGRATLEIQSQRRAEIGMVLRREIECADIAPAAQLDIAGFILALRHVVGGQVGDRRQHGIERRADLGLFGFQRGRAFLERRDLGLQRLGLNHVLGRHRLADRLARLVAAGLPLLQFRLERAALLVQRQYVGGQRGQATARQSGVESGGIFADEADVVHRCPMPPRTRPRNPVRLHPLVMHPQNEGEGDADRS